MRLTPKRWKRAHKTFARIVAHYGPSVYHQKRPGLQLMLVYETNFKKVNFGWNLPGEVGVNFCRCEKWKEVVGTMIHEVWHHHQHPKRRDKKAYEKEANRVAARDLYRFL